MKLIHNSLFRSLCALTVGVLLVMYRGDTVEWMTIVFGVLFSLSGLIAFLIWYYGKRRADKANKLAEEAEASVADDAQSVPLPRKENPLGIGAAIASVGSMLLGLCLALTPLAFIEYLGYVLSALIILGGIQQFSVLAMARRNGPVGAGFWVVPSLLIVAGAVAVIYPEVFGTRNDALFYIGWCMIIYGVAEIVNAIKAYINRRRAEKALAAQQEQLAAEEPKKLEEFTEAEEVK